LRQSEPIASAARVANKCAAPVFIVPPKAILAAADRARAVAVY